MTFKEKLMKEHPKCVDSQYKGGCKGCPHSYGYEERKKIIEHCRDFKCEECWNREIPESEVKNMRFKVGDKVVVREWDEMVKEFNLDRDGDIYINSNIVFAEYMKGVCGQILTIVSIDSCDSTYKVKENFHDYSDEMLMPFEFHKSDLKDGMICKLRNGANYFWINGELRRCDTWCSATMENLCGDTYRDLDIMQVGYPSKSAFTIMDMLESDFEKVIWVRKEEPTVKEFTMDEINKILKEKFPDVYKFKINTKE